jgi:L-lysine exporter family protein LysE/ArgO
MISAIIHGFILSIGLILPLGVQNVFVFNQGSSQKKFIHSLPVVVTASICDTFLITLAVLGVSVLVLGIFWIKISLLSVGILFLLYMGLVIWKSRPGGDTVQTEPLTLKRKIMFSASVSLLNPHAIMDTIGVIGTSSLSYVGEDKIAFTISCVVVSWLWFFCLALLGNLTGRVEPTGRYLTVLNKLSAVIIWGTAVYLIYTLYISIK